MKSLKDKVVIIPTYNEADNVARMLHTVMDLHGGYDVLIVDDGSPDGTAHIVQEIANEYPDRIHLLQRKAKQGLGRAYIAGFKWCLERDYEFIFEMDCDFSHDPNDLPKLYEACKNGSADMSIGSRYVKGVNVVNWPMSRVILSFFASRYVRLVTGLPIHDATAGFVCYSRKVLSSINLDRIKFVGYAFQIEMKYVAWRKGFSIAEIPVIFTDRMQGESKMTRGIIKEAVFGVIRLRIRGFLRKNI